MEKAMWKNFNFVTKYFTKRRQRYITKTIAMNQQEFQLREITYQDIKDLLAIEREVYAGELPWTMSAFMA
ncbi:ribosomal-protein-alanine N-acetyltransferase, partial [Enterococcus faecium]